MRSDVRSVRWSGVGFAVLFAVATVPLLGDLIGAFADRSSSFDYFDNTMQRLRHAAGAYLLTASGFAFLAFVVAATQLFDPSGDRLDGRVARLVSAVFAALLGVSAAALATVSLSIGFGQITGDPGIERVRELLPQLGYVLLFVPAALSAGLVAALVTRGLARARRLPTGVVALGFVTAAAQLVSFYTLPLLLVPIWVLGVSLTLRRDPTRTTPPDTR